MNDVMTDSACRQDYGIPFSGKGQGGPFVSFCLPCGDGRAAGRVIFYFSQKQRDFSGKVWYTMNVRKGSLPLLAPTKGADIHEIHLY